MITDHITFRALVFNKAAVISGHSYRIQEEHAGMRRYGEINWWLVQQNILIRHLDMFLLELQRLFKAKSEFVWPSLISTLVRELY